MALASLQSHSQLSLRPRAKKQQADVMLQQWIASKSNTLPYPAALPHLLVSDQPSGPQPSRGLVEEAKEELGCGQQEGGEEEALSGEEAESAGEEALLLSLSRDVSYLADGISQSQRLQALRRLSASLQSPAALQSSTVSSAVALLVKPLLRRLAEPVEQCRALACLLLHGLLSQCSFASLLSSLPWLLPTLSLRLSSRDLSSASLPYSAANTHTHYPLLQPCEAESSEEVRAQLLGLCGLTVAAFASHADYDAVPLHIPQLVSVLAQGLADRAPALKQQAALLLRSLLSSQAQHVRPYALLLCRVLSPNLLQPQHRVRQSALSALQLLVPLSAAEHIRDLAAFREHNVIDLHAAYHGEHRRHCLAALAADAHSGVREALYRCLGDWLLRMPEAADYETLLLPYLLSGLHDSREASRQLCSQQLTALAERYAAEHEEQMRDAVSFGQAAEAMSRPLLHGLPAPQLRCFPFPGRASLPLRLRLLPLLDRLLPALLSELSDWQPAVRLHSLLLLRTLLWVGEDRVGAQWTQQVAAQAVAAMARRREEADAEEPAAWSEALLLLGRYGGEEVMRQLRRDRQQGRGREALQVALLLAAGLPPLTLRERLTELSAWLREDREAGGPDEEAAVAQLAALTAQQRQQSAGL